MIEIRCSKPGFRRGGVAHPKGVTCYPEDFFSDEDLALIEAEPVLAVTNGVKPTGPEMMSLDELHDALKAEGLDTGGHEPRGMLLDALRTILAEKEAKAAPKPAPKSEKKAGK